MVVLDAGLNSNPRYDVQEGEAESGAVGVVGTRILATATSVVADLDGFGTSPLFFDRNLGLLSGDMRRSAHLHDAGRIDPVALWECLIYDYPFGERTLDRHVLQLPGGSTSRIDRETGGLRTERFEYFNRPGSSSEASFLDQIDARLQEVCRGYWNGLADDERILLPLSGGFDSRLLACYLAKTGDPTRITAVTYGYGKRSLEFKIAQAICAHLGITQHLFYELSGNHYAESVDELWEDWFAQVSPLHSHLLSFLNTRQDWSKFVLVSGFYADPVSGYAAKPKPPKDTPLEASQVHKRLMTEGDLLSLSSEIKSEIEADLERLHREWREGSADLAFDEYLYLSQRQAKTFSLLLASYRKKTRVLTPFSDPALIDLFLSLPLHMRKDKWMLRRVLEKRDPIVGRLGDVSSSVSREGWRNLIQFEKRKWSARIQLASHVLTGGRFGWQSPYLTEDLFTAFRVKNKKQVEEIVGYMEKVGLVSAAQSALLSRTPITTNEFARSARILGLAPLQGE